ncbi:carbohydrate ABC transporter permease [Candidatus Puniceispirillum marinum]|jgi:multiple sugar transport system permease protein|uniref:Binding-protein-dependent transport systems inner membrane component n=1 Tax=Puniceispirillum marinum (strain IMCC1322) TaxID=488538 RepID=D5BU07_PUNMI|nr:sugar ABC transporter permease [Candidatus Puniceispirillum marinum]ADE39754.1 binding-protein-dependent transport systems inner membrane component [Candidatus Puniceispirillum marinum IMCC1322]
MLDIASLKKVKARLGFLFVAPTMLGILAFTAGPILFSFALSFFYWDVLSPMKFAGLSHYDYVVRDEVAVATFLNTIYFALMVVLLQNIIGFSLAMAVRNVANRYFRYFFRSVFFLPLIMSGATVSVFMAYFFDTDFGIVNYYLQAIGVGSVRWLTSTDVVLVTTVLVYAWQHIGFTFILFLGGFASIPEEVIDAADVDGLTGWRKILYVYIPMVSPTIFFSSVIGFIHAVQVFDHPYILTRGGPGDANRTTVMYIYEKAFQDLEFGYGSTLAILLFVIILIATALQFYVQKKWVFYE